MVPMLSEPTRKDFGQSLISLRWPDPATPCTRAAQPETSPAALQLQALSVGTLFKDFTILFLWRDFSRPDALPDAKPSSFLNTGLGPAMADPKA